MDEKQHERGRDVFTQLSHRGGQGLGFGGQVRSAAVVPQVLRGAHAKLVEVHHAVAVLWVGSMAQCVCAWSVRVCARSVRARVCACVGRV